MSNEKTNNWENAPEPATDNEPVTWEWLVSMGFQYHQQSKTFIIPARRGAYNYDIGVNNYTISLRDAKSEGFMILHDSYYHGQITQGKVLEILNFFA